MSVYFARVKGYVKIGYSADPIQRVVTTTRSTIRPDDVSKTDAVDLLGWIPGDQMREKVAHVDLMKHHVIAEWYYDDPEVEAYMLADPEHVDLHRMPGLAVIAIHKGWSRDDALAYSEKVVREWRAESPKYPWAVGFSEASAQQGWLMEAERDRERESYRAARAVA